MLVTSHHVRKEPSVLVQGKRRNTYDLTVPVRLESGNGFGARFWFGVSHELGLLSSGGLTEARGSASKVA